MALLVCTRKDGSGDVRGSIGLDIVENWTNFDPFLQCTFNLGPFAREMVGAIELDSKRQFRRGAGQWNWKKMKTRLILGAFYSVLVV